MIDRRGRPVALTITAGELGAALDLIAAVGPSKSLAADTAYDSDAIPRFLIERGTLPVSPQSYPQAPPPFDAQAYKRRNLIERMLCRLKDFRRVAARYDTLAAN